MRLRPVTTAVVMAVVVAVQVVAVWTVATGRSDPHDVPVVVAAPDRLAGLVAAQGAPSGTLRLTAATSRGDAFEAVREGRAEAALLLDLRRDRSTVLLSSAGGRRLDATLETEVRAVAERFTTRTSVEHLDGGPRRGARDLAFVLAIVAVVLGWAGAVVGTLRRGSVDETFAEAVRRLATSAAWAAGVGVAAALVAGLAGSPVTLGLVAAVTTFTAAVTTDALQSLFGARGLGVATVLFVLAAGPLVTGADPSLLPTPWDVVTPWTLHGAAVESAVAVTFGQSAPLPRALLVLLAWTAAAILTTATARRARRAAGVTLT
ncbi:MAG: hypothetical protein PGN07_01130 [Aeromicrobium erythreum]